MKTALYAGIWLDGKDGLKTSRLDRTMRWIDYYLSIQEKMGFDQIWCADNGSSVKHLHALKSTYGHKFKFFDYNNFFSESENVVNLFRFPDNLKYEGHLQYPYNWRILWFMRDLIARGFDKIIYCDTDAFVVSQKLAEFIRNESTGWQAFHIPRYDFPSGELQILCRDTFPRYLDYTTGHWQWRLGLLIERNIPFSIINKQFKCDRFGEDYAIQTPDMDGYFQASERTILQFGLDRMISI